MPVRQAIEDSGPETDWSSGHQRLDRFTTRDGGHTWRGVVFCGCGWAGGVVGQATRKVTEIELQAVWQRHAGQTPHLRVAERPMASDPG